MKIHPTTGEVLDPTPSREKRGFVYLFLDGIDEILEHQLTPTAYRVLFAVWRRSPLDGHPWDTAAADIAQQLGSHEPDVHKALRQLVAAGLIQRPVRGKVSFVTTVAWRGTTADRRAAEQ